MDNRHFNRKIMTIVSSTQSSSETPQSVIDQVRTTSRAYPVQFPIFWANLAECLGLAFAAVFEEFGRNLDAVDVAVELAERTIQLSQGLLCRRMAAAVFPSEAERAGYNDIASFMRRQLPLYEMGVDDKLIRHVLKFAADVDLVEIKLEGRPDRRVVNQRLSARRGSEMDYLVLQGTEDPARFFMPFTWYTECVPQIIWRTLGQTVFRDGKPMHELGYSIGLRIADYRLVGLNG